MQQLVKANQPTLSKDKAVPPPTIQIKQSLKTAI